MPFAFEKLLVYQKSIDFADAVCAVTRRFPRGYFFLADQLNRAALSIAANLAEGNGRFTVADRRNFFGIARGSVREYVPLLEIAMRQGSAFGVTLRAWASISGQPTPRSRRIHVLPLGPAIPGLSTRRPKRPKNPAQSDNQRTLRRVRIKG